MGRLSAAEGYKGHDLMIRAAAELKCEFPGLRYLIAGDGDDASRLQQLARDCGVADAVKFLGDVARSTLLDLYRSADLFAMPSRGEGFGIVFLEALACGCPVLGFGQDGSVDPLRDGAAGVVSDAGGLVSDLRNMLRQPKPPSPPVSFARDRYVSQVSALVADLRGTDR